MIPISVQLYSLREMASQDFPATLRAVAETGFVGVEFAGFHGHDTAEIARLVKGLGLKVSSAHVPLATAENIDELVDTYKQFDVSLLVSGFGPDQFKTLDAVKESAEKFETAAGLLKPHGMTIAIHNHNWEFSRLEDGRLPYEVCLELAPGLQSELDVYWVKVGGEDPVAMVAKHSSCLPLLHIKDGTIGENRAFTAVGDGVIDIPGVIAAVDENVTEWLTVEIDNINSDMLLAIQRSYVYLTSKGLAAGRV